MKLLVALGLVVASVFVSPVLLFAQATDPVQQGKEAEARGDYAAAIGYFSEAIQNGGSTSKVYLLRGMAYRAHGEYDKAIADFETDLKFYPEDSAAYVGLGRSYFFKGDYDSAIASFTQAIQLNPKAEKAYFGRARSYKFKGDYAQSVASYDQVLQLNPENIAALLNRGVSHGLKGDYYHAIADFTATLQMNPNFTAAYNNLAWMMATCPNAAFRDGKNAVAYATKACELSQWKVPNQLDTLAAAYAEAGDFGSAVQWQSKFLETPSLGAEAVKNGQGRLALYQAHQAYHREQIVQTSDVGG